nr:type IV toxin-antitoxin system AbiEi family antitoxin domain-containing protein [Solirubrobacterales bacterium]
MGDDRLTPLEAAIIARAEAQHGLLRRSDLKELQLGRNALHHRLGNGRLLQLHPGVYALGHRAITREAEYQAAAWWCGGGTALGLQSAAVRKGWTFEDPDRVGPVHLVTLQQRPSRPGVGG